MRCDLLKILRVNIEKQLNRKEFIAEGLASGDLVRKSGEYC